MKKLYYIIALMFASLVSFAQKDYEEALRKSNYNTRVLEEKIRLLENNYQFQLQNLQAQLLLLSAKDTTNQKQLLSTLQLYLQQADKKYAQELADLRNLRNERKSEVSTIVQNHVDTLQKQINQQASMLLYGGLGIIALCIMLFLVALKYIKDQQERYLNEFANNQQAHLKTIIKDTLQENLSKEMQQYFTQHNIVGSSQNQVNELTHLMQNKLADLEAKITNDVLKQVNTESIAEKTFIESTPEEEVITIIETPKNPNQVISHISIDEQKEEKEMIITQNTDNTPIEFVKEESIVSQNELTKEEEIVEEISEIQEHPLINNREWVEQIEQKINESLQASTIEEEVEEQVIYNNTNKEVFEANIYSPEYDTLLKEAMGYYEQKDYEKAIDIYTKALVVTPDYNAYTRRANCYHILKKYDQAAEDYEKAIRLKKDFIPAYNNAIEIYILTDNFFQALTLLERLSQIEKAHAYKAVELYLKLIAQKGLMQNTEKTEKELDALLRENFTFSFSVREIEDWLITADIDTTDKKMIRVKTELLKMKKEYAGVA
ncbi:MAG: tetratricopeptide repeat protein [Raineya sp.]|nr:tetratricopeptide repeat protein [Raineya sp.]